MKKSVGCHLNILLLGACILFAGCDRLDDGLVDWFDDIVNWVRDPVYRGTNIGYLRCLKENEDNPNVGLAKDVVLSRCRTIHMFKLKIPVDAWASYHPAPGNPTEHPKGLPPDWFEPITTPVFVIRMTNKSPNKIITAVEIQVTHFDNLDASGKQATEFLKADNLWIEPFKEQVSAIADLKFSPADNRLKDFSWRVSSIRGLRIKVQ